MRCVSGVRHLGASAGRTGWKAVLCFFSLVGTAPADPVCAPFIEERPAGRSVSFRSHSDAFTHCPVAETTYRRVIADWLETRGQDAPELNGLSLGRAVDFPWISRYLAETALVNPNWNARRGRPVRGDINGYVADLLSQPALLDRLQVPFGDRYTVTAVTVEKVLVDRSSNILPGTEKGSRLAPYDAQVWLLLRPRH